tara:strand:+ start:1131 stop:1280 length:150 start_codon:yes stop_codon:yes gene_type:complete
MAFSTVGNLVDSVKRSQAKQARAPKAPAKAKAPAKTRAKAASKKAPKSE